MKVFCFLIVLPASTPGRAPVARLAVSRQEADEHPLRISEVREIDISADPGLFESQRMVERLKQAAGLASRTAAAGAEETGERTEEGETLGDRVLPTASDESEETGA